jgi:hypothetical protein
MPAAGNRLRNGDSMSDNLHRLATWPRLPAPSDARNAPLFCLVLLTVSCGLASFAFACATPFAAFAAFAGATLPLSAALLVVGAAWIVNQAIGFGLLGYPVELDTFLWGFAIGAAALIATAVSTLAGRLPSIGRLVELGLALLGAYVAYEVVLFAFTPVLGGAGAFTVAIIVRIGLLNLLWMIGLVAAYELLKVFALKHQKFAT